MGFFTTLPGFDFAPVGDVGGGSTGTWYGDLLGGVAQGLIAQLPSIRGRATPPAIPGVPINPPFPVPGVGGAYNVKVNVIGRLHHKRMNPCNPSALRRAIRRVKRFDKFARQSIKITKKVKTPRGRSKCR